MAKEKSMLIIFYTRMDTNFYRIYTNYFSSEIRENLAFSRYNLFRERIGIPTRIVKRLCRDIRGDS